MTIAAAYLTSEGVVLGADSKTTYMVNAGVVQLLDHAQKVYEIGEQSRFGLCTFGLGMLGDMSHRTVAARIADGLDMRTAGFEAVVQALVALLDDWAKSVPIAPQMGLGYFLGGIDMPGRTPKCTRIDCKFSTDPTTGAAKYVIERQDFVVGQTRFGGAPDYFTRIFHGYAPGLLEALRDELKQNVAGLPPDFDTRFAAAVATVRPQFLSAGVTDLPLREAIDFVHTYLQLTVKAFKFKIGPPPCGGPVEIAYISTDRNFRWAKHKLFDSAIRENDTWNR